MNRIVLGIGTSHSPLLTFDADIWPQRAEDDRHNTQLNLPDGRFLSYQELEAERGEVYAGRCALETLREQSNDAQRALDRTADLLERAEPDVVLIIGDDHEELFRLQSMPSIAVYYGRELVMHPWEPPWKNATPGWFEVAARGYAMDAAHRFAGAPDFARALIERLVDSGVDVAGAAEVDEPVRNGIGHAFGFPIQRLFRGRSIPVVPILLNTYYPPNNARPARSYDLGQKLAAAVRAIPGDLRVAVIASGGLSHFVTDEATDRAVISALRDKRADVLRTLPRGALNSGSSETLCWIMAAGALESLQMDWCEYIPVYRTPAGSGIGLAFAIWESATS